MALKTTDLCDKYPDVVRVAQPIGFKNYGGKIIFSGKIATLKCFEDNSLVRKMLEQDGKGKVLVVDGGGSMRCALLGDMLAELAIKNSWNGVVVFGCIRDSGAISKMAIGVKALETNPMKSVKRDEGQENIAVTFAGVQFNAGEYIYCDEDGVIVSSSELSL